MSYVVAVPEFVASAASDLAGIGSGLSAAHAAPALPTTAVMAAAGDEASAAIASLFSGHGKAFQALSAEMSAFHDQFVSTLNAGGGAYAAAEAANASPLQALNPIWPDVRAVINAPTDLLLGMPLIGKGTNGRRGQGKTAGRAGFCSAPAATAGPAPLGSPAAKAVTPSCSATAARAGPAGPVAPRCRKCLCRKHRLTNHSAAERRGN
jgi:hypothetical protein